MVVCVQHAIHSICQAFPQMSTTSSTKCLALNIKVFSMRLSGVQSYNGAQHLFERKTELFSRRLAAVQSVFWRVKGTYGRSTALFQNGMLRVPMFLWQWYSLQKVLAKFLFHALLSWHLVMKMRLSKCDDDDGWGNIWFWASSKQALQCPGQKYMLLVMCSLFFSFNCSA